MGVLEVPLHEVNVWIQFVIGMRPSLPVEGISLILGNDLTGERVMVDPRVLEVPLHEVNVWIQFVIGMRPSLPVEGISLILGNDLTGERVMVDPRVVENPRNDEKTERLAEKFPDIFPTSIVTRSMKAKKEAIKEQGKEEIGLPGTFLENIDGNLRRRIRKRQKKLGEK